MAITEADKRLSRSLIAWHFLSRVRLLLPSSSHCRLPRRSRPLGRPAYPAKAWHRALADADQHDLMRLLAARYRELDKARASVRYVDRIYASALPHMNGQVLHWQAEEGARHRLPGWKKAS